MHFFSRYLFLVHNIITITKFLATILPKWPVYALSKNGQKSHPNQPLYALFYDGKNRRDPCRSYSRSLWSVISPRARQLCYKHFYCILWLSDLGLFDIFSKMTKVAPADRPVMNDEDYGSVLWCICRWCVHICMFLCEFFSGCC